MMSSCFTSKPGSICCALRKLWMNSPAPASATSESATCTMTRTPRRPYQRALPPGALVRSFSAAIQAEIQVACEARRKKRSEHAFAPEAEQNSKRASEERQHQALGEQLEDQTHASRAHGQAHGDFALPLRGARQQQIRDVGAGDEQHQTDNQHHQSAGLRKHTVQLRRNRSFVDGHQHFAAATILLRILFLELIGQRAHGDLCLFDVHSRLEPRHHRGHPESAVIEPLLLHAVEHLIAHGDGNPQVGVAQVTDVVQFARRYANYSNVQLMQLDRSAENTRVSAKLRVPQSVAHHCHWTRRGVLRLRKSTAKKRLHAEYVKEISIHQLGEELLRFLARNYKFDACENGDGGSRKHVRLFAVVHGVEVGRREVFLRRALAALRVRIKTDDARRLLYRY